MVKARLLDLPTTGDRVYVGKRRPFQGKHDPAITIYTTPATSGGQEATERANLGGRLRRMMMLTIQGHVKSPRLVDDTLDDIAAEVEAAIASDPKFGGQITDCYLHSTVTAVDIAGDEYDGGIRLMFMVLYSTMEGVPTAFA
jgi:hypothetical protein